MMLFEKNKILEMIDYLKTKKYRVYLLFGDLGTGKTTFVRNFTKYDFVTSPTFTICNQYDEHTFHFDLYRVENMEKLNQLGFFESLISGQVFIEWPDLVANDVKNIYKNEVCEVLFFEEYFELN